MQRIVFIERLRRGVYGGFPSDESSITDNLINEYLTDGLALAAKQNYKDNFQIESIAYVNNGFYSTFKNVSITYDEKNLFKFTLPQIPLGIGSTEGITRVVFKDDKKNVTLPGVPLSENQVGIHRSLQGIPGKILFYPEGGYCFATTTLNLTEYTAQVTMISGGDATDLDSTLNVPPDYIPVIAAYILAQLVQERNQPADTVNDGQPAVRTT